MASPSEILSQFNLNSRNITKPVPPVLQQPSSEKSNVKSFVSIKNIAFLIIVVLLLGGGGYCMFKFFKKIKEKHKQDLEALQSSNKKLVDDIKSLTTQLKINETKVQQASTVVENKPTEHTEQPAKKTQTNITERQKSTDEKFTLLQDLV